LREEVISDQESKNDNAEEQRTLRFAEKRKAKRDFSLRGLGSK